MDPRFLAGPSGPSLTGMVSGTVPKKKHRPVSPDTFDRLLESALDKANSCNLKISAHANKRLAERNIDMNDSLKASLFKAMGELELKGGKDSLIITKEAAFVVNVPSRTVITAIEGDEMRSGIVTNIDSVSMKD